MIPEPDKGIKIKLQTTFPHKHRRKNSQGYQQIETNNINSGDATSSSVYLGNVKLFNILKPINVPQQQKTVD